MCFIKKKTKLYNKLMAFLLLTPKKYVPQLTRIILSFYFAIKT